MKVVHVQTVVQTVFGQVDEDGNIINKQPASVEIPKLDEESFSAALKALVEAKDKLNAQVEV